ncbi:hypothetical protein VCB98_11885 [Gammaproteobacteria bacterium AB-CW1]|uniref:PEGA domain-containing protein n=1 Tax=Natronospira elongata TaxID=3110268 RepID=A0AAP6MKY1_9GAMM|nr:hypothetical protein [Gammaproteobacteria bacterium AB-CW1]
MSKPSTIHLFCAIVLFAVLAAGCSSLPSVQDRMAMTTHADDSRHAWGRGTGGSEAEARQRALNDLASQVSLWVQEQHGERFEMDSRNGSVNTESLMESLTRTMINVRLDGAELVTLESLRDGWYAEVRLPRDRLDTLRREMRIEAPLQARVHRLESLSSSQPGKRAMAALSGLDHARRLELADREMLNPDGELLTYGSYFEVALRGALSRLDVLPTRKDDGQPNLTVIDRESFRPQGRLHLSVNGESFHTARDGRLPPLPGSANKQAVTVSLQSPEREVLTVPERQRRLAVLSAADWKSDGATRLFVHVEPAGTVVAVNGDGIVAPQTLRVPAGRETHIRIMGRGELAGLDEHIHIPENAPIHVFSAVLQENRTATLHLQTPRGATARVSGPNGFRHSINGRTQPMEVPAGRYRIELEGEDDAQTIRESLVLHEGEALHRQYRPLPDRRFWSRGRLATFGMGVTGLPGDAHPLPDDTAVADIDTWFAQRTGRELDEARFDTALSVGVRIGHLAASGFMADIGLDFIGQAIEFTDAEGNRDEAELSIFEVSPSIGWWTGMRRSNAGFSMSLGTALGMVEWNDDSNRLFGASLESGSSTYAYPFLDLALSWGQESRFALRSRISTDEYRPFTLFLSIGGHRITESGYDLPASTQARAGEHY